MFSGSFALLLVPWHLLKIMICHIAGGVDSSCIVFTHETTSASCTTTGAFTPTHTAQSYRSVTYTHTAPLTIRPATHKKNKQKKLHLYCVIIMCRYLF